MRVHNGIVRSTVLAGNARSSRIFQQYVVGLENRITAHAFGVWLRRHRMIQFALRSRAHIFNLRDARNTFGAAKLAHDTRFYATYDSLALI